MAKRFDFQQFNIGRIGDRELIITCSSVRIRDHVSQRAELRFAGAKWRGYARWYNRPWETFAYENAIHAAAQDLENHGWKDVAATIRKWSEIHAENKSKAAEKFVADFKSEWDKARPSLREAVAAGGPIESEEQAKSTLAILKMGNILNSLS